MGNKQLNGTVDEKTLCLNSDIGPVLSGYKMKL